MNWLLDSLSPSFQTLLVAYWFSCQIGIFENDKIYLKMLYH